MISIQKKFGIEKSILLCHNLDVKNYAERKYPGRFIFAKYFSGAARFVDGIDSLIAEVKTMHEQGYNLGKMQSAPSMRARAYASPDSLRLDEDEMARFFGALKDEGFPFILHLSDPDTYYQSKYTDPQQFSSKERDLAELEGVLKRHHDMQFQIAHFAAQPEIHRLDNLGRWFDTYTNFNIDTSSARWIVRELGKSPGKAREFFKKYSNRIHFGTDCVAWHDDADYYIGRYQALRLFFESNLENHPLPFVDADTVDIGGTFINALALDTKILENIYWKNAHTFFNLEE